MRRSSRAWFRCTVSSPDILRRLAAHRLPLGLRSGATTRSFHRDVYFDAPDGSLQSRGVVCRIRIRDDDKRVLTVVLNSAAGRERFEAETTETDPRRILESDLEPARRLRAVLDPSRLRPEVELEIERLTRPARSGWWPLARFAFVYDIATVRLGTVSRSFQEIKVYRLGSGQPTLDKIALALEREHRLRVLLADKRERARLLLTAMETEVGARSVDTDRAVAVVAIESGRAAFRQDAESLRIPVRAGSGEETCRRLLQESLGSGVGNLHLLGTVSARDRHYALEVWLARQVRASTNDGPIEWIPLDQLNALAASPALRDPDTRAALLVAARAGALGESPVERRHSGPSAPVAAPEAPTTTDDLPAGRYLDADIGLLAFNSRVLALAEDTSTPLLERLRYIGIVGSNVDEFFMVRVGALKHGDREVEGEGVGAESPPDPRLERIAVEARALVANQYHVLRQVLGDLEPHGGRVRHWNELTSEQQMFLRSFFQEQIFPLLTPKAITLAPGHPFPRIPHLALGIGIITRDQFTGPLHFAHLEIPREVPRWIELPEGSVFVPVEDVVRARLDRIFRDRVIDSANMFRVTRSAELNVEEESAGNLLQAVEESASRRRRNAVVRVEVERATSAEMRDRLLRELRFEPGAAALPLRSDDFYDADG